MGGAVERVKEGGKVPAEGSDTHLGARCREFESPHSDHRSILWGTPIFYCQFVNFLMLLHRNVQLLLFGNLYAEGLVPYYIQEGYL